MFSLPKMRPPNNSTVPPASGLWARSCVCRLRTAQRVQVLGVEPLPGAWQSKAHTVNGVLARGVEVEVRDGDVDVLGLRSGRLQAADVRA